ncbi:MAG TPA: hypothetical protein VKK61_10435, partial [Tepidisphaeraceae bacterium]|nr:hypothetical protein [Tepidisphaeraceae bacterium]
MHLYVDNSKAPDSLLFSADSFLIQYSVRAMLAGKIEATRIVAVDPRVHVTEDADTGQRNYRRLAESRPAAKMPSRSSANPLVLPEIVLRNAEVDYTRMRNGVKIESSSSSINIEGQLTPIPESKVYSFAFQSRGRSAEIGPIISGRMVMDTGQITASLQNFEFGNDVKSMLPVEVQQWWEQHELTGRVNTELNYIPATRPGAHPQYRVQIELQGVTLQVHPEEWMSEAQHQSLRQIDGAFDAMRFAGLNQHQFVDHLSEMVEPAPLSLNQVHGRFIFGDDQTIQIDDLNGWVEEMPFKISGIIKGYSPSAEAQIRIGSSDLHDIEIPAAPRYITSLPPAVREIYDRFKPRGICRYWVELDRNSPGARPQVTGEIDIIDASFSFDKFPYPLRKAVGKITLTHDPETGEEYIKLNRIRGRGMEGGPNADSFVEVNGSIGPIGPEAHVDVIVAAQHISSEPSLLAAFPPVTRKALTVFDAPGKGEFPKFSGDFVCSIIRLRGRESHWTIDTNIHLDDASGSLVAFPYPLTGLTGDLKIHGDNLELININTTKGDATMRIDGRVSWPRSDSDDMPEKMPALKPNLKIMARNVPLDQDLLDALPAAQKTWLEKIGAGGQFDIDGTIKPATSADNDLDCDFDIAMHDGT